MYISGKTSGTGLNMTSALWRGGRAVECTSLENWQTFTGFGGSNPPLSAIILFAHGRETLKNQHKTKHLNPDTIRQGSLAFAYFRVHSIGQGIGFLLGGPIFSNV